MLTLEKKKNPGSKIQVPPQEIRKRRPKKHNTSRRKEITKSRNQETKNRKTMIRKLMK